MKNLNTTLDIKENWTNSSTFKYCSLGYDALHSSPKKYSLWNTKGNLFFLEMS